MESPVSGVAITQDPWAVVTVDAPAVDVDVDDLVFATELEIVWEGILSDIVVPLECLLRRWYRCVGDKSDVYSQ